VAKNHSSKTRKGDPLESLLRRTIDDFLRQNRSAQIIAEGLRVIGVGLWPVIDHLTFRTLDVEKRAQEFLKFKYTYDKELGILEYNRLVFTVEKNRKS
jgi:hypothetical protein